MSRVPHKVTVIPPDQPAVPQDIRKQHLRVAPYCRVSTDKDDQLNSYEAQIDYYTEKVGENPEWTMVRIYADEGKTGTSTKRRKEFMEMIHDCEKGKVDLVITKSVSRFGRNTLDGLNYTRKLKSMGIGVFFEKENVNTLYMDNEMILTFFFSQAQAESESLSGNVKWGHRKNFRDGKVYYHYNSFLGYRKGPDGEPEVDEDEAKIVRRIFARYLMGHSVSRICKDLELDGVKTPRGKLKWSDGVVRNMLQNEKYIGDALLQKTYVADLFSHQSVKNTGQLPKYYVHDCHPAIIDRETFQKVQEEMARRASLRKTSGKAKTELARFSGKYALNELLVCGECGKPYRRRLWMPQGEKYYVWRCLNRLEYGKKACKCSPTLLETDLHEAILSAMNEMFQQRVAREVLNECLMGTLSTGTSLSAIEAKIQQLQRRQLELFELMVDAKGDCPDYEEELGRIYAAKSQLMSKAATMKKQADENAVMDQRLNELQAETEKLCGSIITFDDQVVHQLISFIKVLAKDRILIRFKDGTEIEQIIETERGAKAS